MYIFKYISRYTYIHLYTYSIVVSDTHPFSIIVVLLLVRASKAKSRQMVCVVSRWIGIKLNTFFYWYSRRCVLFDTHAIWSLLSIMFWWKLCLQGKVHLIPAERYACDIILSCKVVCLINRIGNSIVIGKIGTQWNSVWSHNSKLQLWHTLFN